VTHYKELESKESEKGKEPKSQKNSKLKKYISKSNERVKGNYFEDPEYWMHRGQMLKQLNNIDNAIRSYK